ncbi:MAG TPA: maltose alpha-D-glucosyltransferase [Candidatus Binatia bacterium]|nr:maltose alpha-D-glucosyltransferase [Candidatus Binatia bacterium]
MARIRRPKSSESLLLEDNPQWYKDAVIYEVHVRAFCDGNNDGIGDFQGLTQKLDFLQDLGVTAVWLLPFYPSPLKDDGYDIADYTDIHPDYGTLQDFKNFLRAAHERGIRVITELVINHTSDQHPWFQRARLSKPGTSTRNFYVWSDTQEKYQDARVIFKDFEPSNWSWDHTAKAYYWHRFYSHQPELNFDNPDVWKALSGVLDFWLEMGVDGLRLDAVPYLFEREGTNCENLPETHAFLKQLRQHVDRKFKNRMLLAEANQWPEEAVAYFGTGDECHMAFHFPVMPRLFMSVHMEDRFPIIDILDQTPPIPEVCQWALFLRNHDELTLEMVTDEDRDYMYKVYATDPRARINLGIRRRLAPLLGNNRRKMELLNSLLFSLPGTPVIYYGDEIGMGDNIYLGDRNGVRTPMQWSADRNAGFSRANPQRLYLPVIIDPEHHYETVNVDAQQQNPSSLLWWMKRLVLLSKNYQAFGRGTLEFLFPENRKVLVFIRRFQEEIILVVSNLSRFVNYVELDLPAYKGMIPMELFGHTRFPTIGELPYFLTLGPHSFYWFKLEQPRISETQAAAEAFEPPRLEVEEAWENILEGRPRATLERILPAYLLTCRWFGGKAQPIRSVKNVDRIPFTDDSAPAFLTTWEVQYTGGIPESYLLPLAFASGDRAFELRQASPQAVIAQLKVKAENADVEGILYDAIYNPQFCKSLLAAIARGRRFKADSTEVHAQPAKSFRAIAGSTEAPMEPSLLRGEQTNTSVIFGDRLFFKLFRRVTEGINPDLEIGRFLTEKTSFAHVPPLAGFLEMRRGQGEPGTLGILQGLVPNEGDAWRYTQDSLGHYFEEILSRQLAPQQATIPETPLVQLAAQETPPLIQELMGAYLSSALLLGRRTGELHVALASDVEDPAFSPEPFTALYRRSLYQSLRTMADQSLSLLEKRLQGLPQEVRPDAERVVKLESAMYGRLRQIVDKKMTGMRIRCHGDFHLGQVLFTGKDFVIIDFEGEPARPITERRLKRSPLRDVAGMLRSFNYAALSKLRDNSMRPEDVVQLRPWARFWDFWVSVTYLKGYFEATANATFMPKTQDEINLMLSVYILEKAIYELAYELNNRPAWVDVPIAGILQIMKAQEAGG